MNVNDFIFRTCSYAHSFYNGILMCMRNQSKSSATAEQGWKDLCTQQIQVTIGIPPNETQFSSFSISIAFQPKFLKRYLATNNAISNPQQKSEDMQNPIGVNMACEEVCMLENARQQVHTRAGFPGWKQKTCFVFVGHHLLPVNRSMSMPTIVLFQQLYNSINLSDINFLCTSSSGLWKTNQAFAQSSQ